MPGAGPDQVLVAPGQRLLFLDGIAVAPHETVAVPVRPHDVCRRPGVERVGLRPR
jgi:hypothetical protein